MSEKSGYSRGYPHIPGTSTAYPLIPGSPHQFPQGHLPPGSPAPASSFHPSHASSHHSSHAPSAHDIEYETAENVPLDDHLHANYDNLPFLGSPPPPSSGSSSHRVPPPINVPAQGIYATPKKCYCDIPSHVNIPENISLDDLNDIPSHVNTPKVVLVTGANKGLGYHTILKAALREPSYAYILCSRSRKRGHDALVNLRALGVTSFVDVCLLDVTNDEHISRVVKHVEARYGRLDVLINNVGRYVGLDPESQDLSKVRKTYADQMNTNMISAALMVHAFKHLLRRSADPKVINVSGSIASMEYALARRIPYVPQYGVSKAAVNALTAQMHGMEEQRVWSEDQGDIPPSGLPQIKFYAVTPGVIKTQFSGFKGRPPEEGAEVIFILLKDHDTEERKTYASGTFWEYKDGHMRRVPW